MKSRNIVILCLLFVGVISFGIVQGIVIPQRAEDQKEYVRDQQYPLTHDIEAVLKYRNKYMGNASNTTNLFHYLPISNIDKSFQLLPDVFTAEVNYKEAISNIEKKHLETSLIYNATAAFSLIANLDALHFNFVGSSYKVKRSDVATWYGVELSTLSNKDTWHDLVQNRLADEDYVSRCMDAMILKD